MGLNTWFRKFHENIYIKNDVVEKINLRYRTITNRINKEYWYSDSCTNNSFYTGSYARGTEIKTSDIDVVVVLPQVVKERFDRRCGNIQSQFLSEVKEKLQKSYPSSEISSDGQVIVIKFSDGIKFEVVPVFELTDRLFYYADTNNGGIWKLMSPKLEIDYFNKRHSDYNYTMKKLCRMIRAWKEHNNITISGELIDTMVYNFYKDAMYVERDPYLYFDYISRDFFKYIEKNAHMQWPVFGSDRLLRVKYPYLFESESKKALDAAEYAIECGEKYPYLAQKKWREIYGSRFGN